MKAVAHVVIAWPFAPLQRIIARVATWCRQSDLVTGRCSRCHVRIRGYRPPDGGFTAGYYVAAAWSRYANPGETIICDACMWRDPAYIVDYGHVATSGYDGEDGG